MRKTILATAVAGVLLCAAQSMAARCSVGTDGYSEAAHTWCDDFDQYCEGGAPWTGGPPFPQGCPTDDTAEDDSPNYTQLRQQWPKFLDCPNSGSIVANVEPNSQGRATTRPMILSVINKWAFGTEQGMAQFSHEFSDRITTLDPTKNAVNGTDANPLILRFRIDDGGTAQDQYDNAYVELSLGTDRAPTDYGMFPAWGTFGPYPVICQQPLARIPTAQRPAFQAICPPATTTVHNSIAVGFLAFQDPNPTHSTEEVAHKPTRNHWMVFDGIQWWELRTNVFRGPTSPGGGGGGLIIAPGTGPIGERMSCDTSVGCGNFSFNGGAQEATVKITTQHIMLYVENSATGSPWKACIPRKYPGSFDTISVGVAPGCELDNVVDSPTRGQCKAPAQCISYGKPGDGMYYPVQFDTVSLLYGELGYEQHDGACCLPDGTCSVLDQSVCVAQNGHYNGRGSACTPGACDGACCEPFGICESKAFGTCTGQYNGVGSSCGNVSCACSQAPYVWADSDADGDVDMDDFGRFQTCFNGGTPVPADCRCFDHVASAGVDGLDFTEFLKCTTGANIPYDLGSLQNGCTP